MDALVSYWESISHIREYEFYGNPLEAWVIALLWFLAVMWLCRTLRDVIAKKLRVLAARTEDLHFDDVLADLVQQTKVFLFAAFALEFVGLVLTLPNDVEEHIHRLPIIALMIQAGLWGNRIVRYVMKHYQEKYAGENGETTAATLSGPIRIMLSFCVWVMVALMLLANFGVNITALIAGLGVGGIAVGFALQKVLEDIFAAVSIAIDKPFKKGDFLIVGDFLGNVESVGMKTTRLKSLTGEMLIFSNSDLLSSRIKNYKPMTERRITFTLGTIYGTPVEKLEQIPGWIKDIIDSLGDRVRYDRSHFAAYGDFSLNFETVYYVHSGEYQEYMDCHQYINLAVYRKFTEEGVEFAFPTQSLFIEKNQLVGRVETALLENGNGNGSPTSSPEPTPA